MALLLVEVVISEPRAQNLTVAIARACSMRCQCVRGPAIRVCPQWTVAQVDPQMPNRANPVQPLSFMALNRIRQRYDRDCSPVRQWDGTECLGCSRLITRSYVLKASRSLQSQTAQPALLPTWSCRHVSCVFEQRMSLAVHSPSD